MKISQLVSVVIVTKDRQDSLSAALSSLAQQSVLPAEVIVIDDGSNPKVQESCLKVIPEEIHARLYRNEKSQGASFSRNRAIKLATKEFIAFLDDDDLFRPRKIQVLDHWIREVPKIDLFCHRANVVMVREGLNYLTRFRKKTDDEFKELLISNWVGGASLVVCRKLLLEKIGLFDVNLPACEDWDLWIRCAKFGAKIQFLDEVLVDYSCVTKKTSLSHSIEKNRLAKDLIKKKYRTEILKLSETEILRLNESSKLDDLQRFLVNYNYKASVSCAFDIFISNKKISNLLRLVAVILGTKISIKLRSLLS